VNRRGNFQDIRRACFLMTYQQRRYGQPDRRRQTRGGRRPIDRPGHSPLVFVVEEDAHRRDVCEAILAKLLFAVVPLCGVRDAVAALNGLRPDAVVVGRRDAADLRGRLPSGRQGGPIPVVEYAEEERSAEAVVESLRTALHTNVSVRD
jgi:hypothetical protein